jgi:hypothetical protein
VILFGNKEPATTCARFLRLLGSVKIYLDPSNFFCLVCCTFLLPGSKSRSASDSIRFGHRRLEENVTVYCLEVLYGLKKINKVQEGQMMVTNLAIRLSSARAVRNSELISLYT